jgi:predicted CoA-substrate-specific enzyme activase
MKRRWIEPLPGATAMSCVGVNVGALTVKVVAVRDGSVDSRVVAHQGRPQQVLAELLAEPAFAGAECYGVSGRLGHIAESAAIQRALREVAGEFDAVASLGGESFLVYTLARGRIANVLSHNKCAAGSGEFLVQQIGRMGLAMEDAIRRSFEGQVVPLASRCSVHCKSDITHKLNRNEATVEDILHTLHDSTASKVVALLEKGQCALRRVLVIGGVTRNAAVLAALRDKLPATEFVVLAQSPWFEAWGSALLARDEPVHASPLTAPLPAMDRLPPLAQFAGSVRVIPAAARVPPPEGPLVLGVDAGSTTTKAVLLDGATRGVVASHYTRTRGDPVAAVRECLRALAAQAGDRPVGLVATTGSARELVGAYLGTGHVYNEISAHAAGAAHFDAEVDTIFEIGGQDAKYIHLRNGVPIDYAMNNACSAGTGSFLEESAQGDLGIGVADIAGLALAAPAPVHFKATCAAFINSDIRIAQQQGQRRDDIVAGLAYAIAANFLNRVKGPRPVGRKVFLQGGVALNRAVGHAFAQQVGRQVVIPPDPELLGALGVGLLALQRTGGPPAVPATLLALAAREMQALGRFTCGACKMYCSVDRFRVAGRQFPFGGRCSLFENVWKQKARTAAAPDLVEQRAGIVFSGANGTAVSNGGAPNGDGVARRASIGIPRALTTHSLYPLYAAFFSGLGLDVVLSDVDPRGELKSHSGFCLPAQIAHGAVLDLARRGVGRVFLPHVVRMPREGACRDSYLCPITQAGPYVLAKAFPEVRCLAPVLDFTGGYEASPVLEEMAVRELGASREQAAQAWGAAVRAQADAERRLRELGERALAQALASGEPAILLAGHSYNAFAAEASQSVGKKLASMGVTVIPADCLAPAAEGPTAWHFANQILSAVALVRRHPNLFLVCVSNFSCTIDAFTHATLAGELGAKPHLILEIDSHTADAGVQTRLEAFLDIMRSHRDREPRRGRPFEPCRLVPGGRVQRSNGEQVPLTDPRVKLFVPNFSDLHSEAFAMVVRWLGLHPGDTIPLGRGQLEQGLRYTSGRECLPLPIAIGQLLHIHEHRRPGEILGYLTVRGGAPCVSDAYPGYFERFIAEQHLDDIFLFGTNARDVFLDFDAATLARHLAPATLMADLLVEIEHVLRVVGAPGSLERFRAEWRAFAASTRTLKEFEAVLPAFVGRLASLERVHDPSVCPRVVVTGDFFTRFSPFFMEGVRDRYAGSGIILKPVDLSDFIFYNTYNRVAATAGGWGMKPGNRALARACTRVLQADGQQYLRGWLGYQAGRKAEQHYRSLFQKTGLLVAGENDVAALFESAAEHVSPAMFGEAIPTIGKGLAADREGFDGIIVIGPFNCLPYRISEAILKPLCIQRGMPILTYESDGYSVAPAVLRQVEVHIQQVLARHGQTRDAPAPL